MDDLLDQVAAHNAEGAWDDPNTDLIDDALLPAPPFPIEVLRPFARWTQVHAASVSAPVDWSAMALIACAAMCIGAVRRVRPWASWDEPPGLWAFLVGKPSTGKSPTLRPFIQALTVLQSEEAADFPKMLQLYELRREQAEEAHVRWKQAAKEAYSRGDPPPPVPDEAVAPPKPGQPRILVGDATIEKLGEILAANPRGVLKALDEIAGWLANNGKYGGDDAPDYLSFFSGASYTVDRLNRESIAVESALVGVLGGIQPDRFQELLLQRSDDGLVSRVLPIYPDPVRRERPRTFNDPAELVNALRRLRGLQFQKAADGTDRPITVPLEADAESVFETWWQNNLVAANAAEGFLLSFLGKGPGVVLRLALTLEFLWWSHAGIIDAPVAVSREAVLAACDLYDHYLVPMAERVYDVVGRSHEEVRASQLLKLIRQKKLPVVNASEIRRDRWLGLHRKADVDAAITRLVNAGWLRPKPSRAGQTKGRQRKDYEVNPLLWTSGPD